MPRPTPGTRGRSPRRVQTATCLLFLPHGRGAGAGQAVARRDGPSPPGPDFRGEPVSCIPANDGHPWPSERSAGRPRGTDGRTIGSTGRGGSREGRGHRSHRQRGDKRRPRPCGAPAGEGCPRYRPSPARPGLIPALPAITGLRFQALHTDDAAAAYLAAVLRAVRGPFNRVADPVLDIQAVARLLDARNVPRPPGAARAALAAAWRLHVAPADPGLLDAVLRLPLLDAGRARDETACIPSHTATDAVGAFLEGLHRGAGLETPPLAAAAAEGAGR